ncbi:MAG: hypothetical protein M1836_006963 [Candelina mexicana]|nr:MAG: hypothetical protein M1836_006963 [Candelina mexicana]
MNPSPPFDSDLLRLSLGGEFFAIRQTFPFLKLPAELRNHVYRHLLDRATRAPPVDDMEHHRWLAPYSPMERPGLETSILATSRQVHDEAAHILYGCQLFHTNASSCAATHYSSKCDEALELLAPEYLQRITRVSIDIYYRVPVTSMGRLMNSHLKFRAHIAQICVLLAQCTLVEVRVNEHYSHMCSWGQANQEVLGWILENRHLKLEPFKALQNVGKVIFGGDVNPEYARELKETMEGEVTPEGQTMAQRNSQERGLQSYPNHQQLID